MTRLQCSKRLLRAVLAVTLAWGAFPAVGWAQPAVGTHSAIAFRSELIDYFSTFGLVPVIATRDFSIGDVVQVDGVDFFARRATCFPNLAVPASTPQSLPGSVQTSEIGLDAALSLTRVFSAGAQASLVHRAIINYDDVTAAEVDLKTLRSELDRKACPEIIPLIDGTIATLRKGEKPFFVVAAVYLGKPEAALQVVDKAHLNAEVARIGQLGQGSFSVTAGTGDTVLLKGDRPVVIAVRPMTVPEIVQVGSYSLRGDDNPQLRWKSAACTPGADCKATFGPFAAVIKAWAPAPDALKPAQ
jgi:hypothetical protein